jgi:RHS repeat-associated protein
VIATTNTGQTVAGKQYVNRFADQSNLDYLTARYYNPSQGQFITQDPVFWSSKQNLANPQSLNSYSYTNDNPITGTDPDGLADNSTAQIIALIQQAIAAIQQIISIVGGGGGSSQSTGQNGTTQTTTVAGGSGSAPGQAPKPSNSFGNQWIPGGGTGYVAGPAMPRLDYHFVKHGQDFGANSPEEYNQMADDFLKNLPNNPNAQAKFNPEQSTLRAYDPTSNSFGSYNTDTGAARTLMKPNLSENPGYWEQQTGTLLTSEELLEIITILLPK